MIEIELIKYRQECREKSTSDVQADISNFREENDSMLDDICKNNIFIQIAKEELLKKKLSE